MDSSQRDSDSDIRAGTGELLARSRLFLEYCAEREEILRHKWFESEKAGYGIGFDRARMSWVVHHRGTWRKTRSFRENS